MKGSTTGTLVHSPVRLRRSALAATPFLADPTFPTRDAVFNVIATKKAARRRSMCVIGKPQPRKRPKDALVVNKMPDPRCLDKMLFGS